MRIGDSEREQLFERLSRHAAAGRLDVAELERRVAAVSAAQTQEEAAAVLADLPPLPPATPEARQAHRRRRLGWKPSHGEAQTAAPDWRPTAERFRDPRTKRVMRVWEDAAGTRHYLPDDDSP